jgi:transposase-like protein
MERKAQQPKTLQAAIQYFSDEQTCIDTVASLRWPNGPVCPSCEHKEHYYLASQKRWKCKECGRQFSVKLGTIFEDSAIPLNKWLVALWMLVNCRNGISSYEVARDLGITQKSAWFVLHRLRLALQEGSLTKLGGGGAPVEVDETFIGGKARNMHKGRRNKMTTIGKYTAKTAVLGLLERGGKVRATVIGERKGKVMNQIVRELVAPGAEIHTDEFPGYLGLSDEYVHNVINHLDGYVREHVSTNGIENFWSLLKRSLGGTYVSVEPFHLFRYADEQAFRFNSRKDALGNKLSDAARFDIALSRVAGKRLTFAGVTGKTGSEAIS